jgi:hypothetical protein
MFLAVRGHDKLAVRGHAMSSIGQLAGVKRACSGLQVSLSIVCGMACTCVYSIQSAHRQLAGVKRSCSGLQVSLATQSCVFCVEAAVELAILVAVLVAMGGV